MYAPFVLLLPVSAGVPEVVPPVVPPVVLPLLVPEPVSVPVGIMSPMFGSFAPLAKTCDETVKENNKANANFLVGFCFILKLLVKNSRSSGSQIF
jgi:hypothetical protein